MTNQNLSQASSSAARGVTSTRGRLRIVPLGMSLGGFLVISYLLCLALGLVVPDAGTHKLFLQFLPGFVWLTWPSFFLGLAESFAYGWYAALVFAPLYNFCAARWR